MEVEPCPVCGNSKTLRLHSLSNNFRDVAIGTYTLNPGLTSVGRLILLAECLICTSIFDPALVISDWLLPELKQDEEGYYVEGIGGAKISGSLLFKLPKRWHIDTTTDVGKQYLESMKIATAKTVSELPTGLVSENEGLRRFAAKRMEELKGR